MGWLKSLICWHERRQYDTISLPGVTSSGRVLSYRAMPRTIYFAQCKKCGEITQVVDWEYNSLPPPPTEKARSE